MAEVKSSKMDLSELAKIVVDRIQRVDPANVSKIMGFILLKEACEREMMKLAFCPGDVLLSKIDEAKRALGFVSPNKFSVSSQKHSLQNLGFTPQTYPDSIREGSSVCKQSQLFNLEEKMESSSSAGKHYCHQDSSFNGSLPSRTSRRSTSLLEFPIKACHYFNKGFCKHGENCRYFHDHHQAFGSHLNEIRSEQNGLSIESLEKLEMEIAELLKSQRGAPVSISLLIMLYYEKYGRILRADGYLTKLLSTFNNSICLLNRPLGQHSIVLTEDAPKYLECRHERSEEGTTSAGSHQIYLTFPADSTFSEDDISSYFKQFGPVKDVRIPCQEKRMYGFVRFLYPETVCDILMKKNPHYIGGSRVLVKPYKEKSRMVGRSYNGVNKLSMHHPCQYLDLDSEFFGIPRKSDSERMIKLHLVEQQKMIEIERSRLARFNLVQEHQQSNNKYRVNDPKLLEVADSNHIKEDHLGFTLDILNTGLSSHVKTRNTSNNYSHKESGYFELPENPFGSPPLTEHNDIDLTANVYKNSTAKKLLQSSQGTLS